jgi:mono/diheme cytochrome c family protein
MNLRVAIPLVAAIALCAPGVQAQGKADQALILGKASFAANCATCHGDDATGNGPYAQYLNVQPSNLTLLSDKAGGAFPFSEVYQLIDGRKMVRTHGEFTDMPIWGTYFTTDSLADRGMDPDDIEHVIQGRILSLVYYLESIQK